MKRTVYGDGSKIYNYRGVEIDYEAGQYIICCNHEQGAKLVGEYGSNCFLNQKEVKEAINYILG